jgi:hypothetical protein
MHLRVRAKMDQLENSISHRKNSIRLDQRLSTPISVIVAPSFLITLIQTFHWSLNIWIQTTKDILLPRKLLKHFICLFHMMKSETVSKSNSTRMYQKHTDHAQSSLHGLPHQLHHLHQPKSPVASLPITLITI